LIYQPLGKTGIVVSRLCMGVLTISPLQSNLPLDEGADLLVYAMQQGINFFDTAKIYNNYPYIKQALAQSGLRPVLTSKSYDYTYKGMKESVEQALDEMGIDYIDIFMLHEQESELTLKGHREALQYLLEAREKGIVRAVGMSTHSVRGVMAGARAPEIEVIHPLINQQGLGIMDGSREEMLKAIAFAHAAGKGIYAMKALGGGNLLNDAYNSFAFVRDLPSINSMAVGMKSRDEIDLNIAWMEDRRVPALESRVARQPRRLIIEDECLGCGKCTEHCRYEALKLENGRTVVEQENCILCGYCSRFCEQFCIKII
jgi:aryl-alcohol dehydrogenase-like predicted oxidoreductase